jgi:hypothetical protein
MKRSAALFVVLVALQSRAVLTQGQPVHAPDGDSGISAIFSIAVPPLPNAPFSATVNTEETRYLPNGSPGMISRNHRLIARDGQGRVFQERRMIVPAGSPMDSQLTQTEIANPTTRTIAVCDPNRHICDLRIYRAPATATLPPAGPSADGASYLTREALGTQTVNGFEMVGTREVLTLATNTDRPLSVTKEFWYSPLLGLNVSTRRWDPRIGRVEVFSVTDINLSEPDPNLFTLPADARVMDFRTPSTAR